MSSSTYKTDDSKRMTNIFSLIVTKDPNALNVVNETLQKDPHLLTRKLTFTCENILDFAETGCACVLDHENFRYVSGDTVNEEALARIVRSIACGQCAHHDSLPGKEEDEDSFGPLPTSVTLAHATAVVGNVPVLKILLQLTGTQSPLTEQIRSSPLHLAILHNQQLCVRTIIESQTIDLQTYCGCFDHQQQNVNRPNSITFENMSTFELCVRMNNFEALKQILQSTPLQANWVIDALKSKSDEIYETVSQYINAETLVNFDRGDANEILHDGITKGEIGLVEKLIKSGEKGLDKYSPILFAVVYDQPKILEYLWISNPCKKDINFKGFTLMDISDSLNHVDCSSILRDHGINPTQRRTKHPLRVMLEIGKRYGLGQYTDILIQKVGHKKNFEDRYNCTEALTLLSLREFDGLGVRGLLSLCHDIDFKGPDGLSPLALAMKDNINPLSILDVLYSNPSLNQFEQKGMDLTWIEKDLQLYERSKVKDISMLALAIERDLKNYSVNRALEYFEFWPYEGSIAVLLLDCGYDVRADILVHFSYSKHLETCSQADREDEIRSRIKLRIDRELYFPKPLKERCRDVLRRHLTGHSLHRYVSKVNVPLSVREFVLMEARLKLPPQNVYPNVTI